MNRSNTSSVAVVIPAFNASKWLPLQLAALETQQGDLDFVVHVSDNGSIDGTRDIVLGYNGPLAVSLIDASAHPGAAYARNAGAAAATAEILAFCDADDIVDECWLSLLVEALTGFDRAIVIGGLRYGRVNDTASLNAYKLRAEQPMQSPNSVHLYTDKFAGYLPSLCSANFAIRRADYERMGGMDTSFVSGAEDTEFAWRSQELGMKIVAAPAALVDYRLRDTARSIFRQQRMRHIGKTQLWSEYGPRGMVGPSWRGSVFQLSSELARLPWNILNQNRRLRAAHNLGAHIGAIQGMVTFRIFRRVAPFHRRGGGA